MDFSHFFSHPLAGQRRRLLGGNTGEGNLSDYESPLGNIVFFPYEVVACFNSPLRG